jgi:MerR family copper efflux transcriptional regulator
MSQELPIACSLGADTLTARLELIAAVGAGNLLSRGTEGDTQLLSFRRDDGVRRSLEEVIAAEGECCPFLDMEIREEGGALVLVIDGPPEGASVAAELAAAFAAA